MIRRASAVVPRSPTNGLWRCFGGGEIPLLHLQADQPALGADLGFRCRGQGGQFLARLS